MRDPELEVFDIENSKRHLLYRFDNGIGASVIKGDTVPGTWDLAILRYHDEEFFNFHVEHAVEIGTYQELTSVEVDVLLAQIEKVARGKDIPMMN